MKVSLIQAQITLTAPFAIGAINEHVEIDLKIVTDGDDNPFVPGSSIAGSLRSHLGQLQLADEWMGYSDDPETTIVPSRIRVLGTKLHAPNAAPANSTKGGTAAKEEGDQGSGTFEMIQRKRVAIDPLRAAARPGALWQSEFLPPGTKVTVFLRVDEEIDESLLQPLATWSPQLGRNQTIGMGAATLSGLQYGVLDLAQSNDLLTWLQYGGAELFSKVATTPVEIPDQNLNIVISQPVEIVDGLAVGSGEQGVAISHDKVQDRPVLRDRDGSLEIPVIEGSSIKGVLRSRAGFILRSLEITACTDHEGCGQCAVCELFGSSNKRGLIAIHRSRISNAQLARHPHVAIDRFTGGANDKLLFEAEVVTSGHFSIEITNISNGALEPWATNLLRWCMRDLLDGFVGLGGLTARGHGTVAAHGEDTIGTPEPIDLEEIMKVGAA